MAGFPNTLLHLLDNKKYSHIMGWGTSGGFWIKYKAFQDEIMPVHFSGIHKFASFIRKMNRYGFRKISNLEYQSQDIMFFDHDVFAQGISHKDANTIHIQHNHRMFMSATSARTNGHNNLEEATMMVPPVPYVAHKLPEAPLIPIHQSTSPASSPSPPLPPRAVDVSVLEELLRKQKSYSTRNTNARLMTLVSPIAIRRYHGGPPMLLPSINAIHPNQGVATPSSFLLDRIASALISAQRSYGDESNRWQKISHPMSTRTHAISTKDALMLALLRGGCGDRCTGSPRLSSPSYSSVATLTGATGSINTSPLVPQSGSYYR